MRRFMRTKRSGKSSAEGMVNSAIETGEAEGTKKSEMVSRSAPMAKIRINRGLVPTV